MNKSVVTCLLVLSIGILLGCSSSSERAQSRQEKHDQLDVKIKASIPPDSPLAKLNAGMSEGEVTSILGQPSSSDGHTTGKQFIPFNFAGSDVVRTIYYYKGIGRVEFSSGSWGQRNGVVLLTADTSEPGFHRNN